MGLGKLDSLRLDDLNDFDSANDTVVTDAASRTASKADVSGLATSAALTVVDGNVDAIRVTTDNLTFSGTDLVATLDSEAVTVGDIATAALAKFVNVNTGEVIAAANSVADLATGVTAQGVGANQVTLTYETSGNPIADADVWITSDAAGTLVVAGTLQTNSNGKATFLLDAGSTYYAWMQKDGLQSIQGTQFVAEAD
jgi:hypothetical protein